jgi:hypothetical protein
MNSFNDNEYKSEISYHPLKLMKTLSIRSLPLTLNPAGIQSRITHPLVQVFGLLVLASCVATHFYALGARSEADGIAYNESATWKNLGKGMLADASATEVLFSRASRHFAAASLPASGTIQNLPSSLQQAASPNRNLPRLASPDDLEATLLALNYGY